MEINFDSLFDEGGNILEVYLCAGPSHGNKSDMSVGLANSAQLRVGNTVTLREYYYKDMQFSYDRSNDAQRLTRRILTKDIQAGGIYLAVFKEEQMPPFMFPVTTQVAYECDIKRKSMRLNNRLFMISDTEATNDHDDAHYLYLRYTHASNVDMSKVKADINAALQQLIRYAR